MGSRSKEIVIRGGDCYLTRRGLAIGVIRRVAEETKCWRNSAGTTYLDGLTCLQAKVSTKKACPRCQARIVVRLMKEDAR